MQKAPGLCWQTAGPFQKGQGWSAPVRLPPEEARKALAAKAPTVLFRVDVSFERLQAGLQTLLPAGPAFPHQRLGGCIKAIADCLKGGVRGRPRACSKQ